MSDFKNKWTDSAAFAKDAQSSELKAKGAK
jgi:hypothetical protein